MPDETPEDNANEADVEAEMLRMMQEEIEGGEDQEADAGTADGEDAPEDTMAALQEAVGQEGADAPEVGVDEMLEQEMLRAMTDDSGAGDAVAPYVSQAPALPENAEGIDRLSDVEVTVTVELGGTNVPISDIIAWSRDATIELESYEQDAVRVLVNGKLYALGEVVVVEDTFGVKILEMVNQPEEPGL